MTSGCFSSGQHFEGIVESRDAKLSIPHDDRCVCIIEKAFQVFIRFPQFLFRVLALGNVARHLGGTNDIARNILDW